MNPFLAILTPPFCPRVGVIGTAVRGVPGDVGGLARGAELIEWAPRLCAWVWERLGSDSADRVFVKVMDTEKGSPAKYEDWVGVTTTRMGESESPCLLVPLMPDIRSKF